MEAQSVEHDQPLVPTLTQSSMIHISSLSQAHSTLYTVWQTSAEFCVHAGNMKFSRENACVFVYISCALKHTDNIGKTCKKWSLKFLG